MNPQQLTTMNYCIPRYQYSSIIYVQTTLNVNTVIDKISHELDVDKYGEDITYIDRQLKYHNYSDDDLLIDSQNRTGILISYIIDSQSVLDDTIKVLSVYEGIKHSFRCPIHHNRLLSVISNMSIRNMNIEEFYDDNTITIGVYMFNHKL